MAFVDFEKAFDSIKTEAILDSLVNQGIEDTYVATLEYIYYNATSSICLHTNSEKFEIQRGIRQGDTISPKLFKTLNWEKKGIRIHCESLNHLKFADDIILMTGSLEELEIMLNELNISARKSGLKMNQEKTKAMHNEHITGQQMKVGDQPI